VPPQKKKKEKKKKKKEKRERKKEKEKRRERMGLDELVDYTTDLSLLYSVNYVAIRAVKRL